MGQVCDENISRPVESNTTAPGRIPSAPAPGRIPSAPALDRTPNAPQVPSPIGTRTQETPAPGAQPEGGGLQNMGDGNLPCPAPTDKNAGEGAVTHPDELR